MKTVKNDLNDLVVIENVLGQEIKLYVGPTLKKSHAWEEKEYTKNCEGCYKCIGILVAIDIIKVAGEKQGNRWISPPEERILGICVVGIWPKVLAPPRTGLLKRCRYSKNGYD